jgi:hypothetical protein
MLLTRYLCSKHFLEIEFRTAETTVYSTSPRQKYIADQDLDNEPHFCHMYMLIPQQYYHDSMKCKLYAKVKIVTDHVHFSKGTLC